MQQSSSSKLQVDNLFLKQQKAVRIYKQSGKTYRVDKQNESIIFYCYMCENSFSNLKEQHVCPGCNFDHNQVPLLIKSQEVGNDNVGQAITAMLGGLNKIQPTNTKLTLWISVIVFLLFGAATFSIGTLVGYYILK